MRGPSRPVGDVLTATSRHHISTGMRATPAQRENLRCVPAIATYTVSPAIATSHGNDSAPAAGLGASRILLPRPRHGAHRATRQTQRPHRMVVGAGADPVKWPCAWRGRDSGFRTRETGRRARCHRRGMHDRGNRIFRAMAGTHQIFALRGSGTRRAERGGEWAVRTSPTGRRRTHCWRSRWGSSSRDRRRLYFVDAESSSVRLAGSGAPSALVKSARSVGTGLFELGTRDGDSETTRLQHSAGSSGIRAGARDGRTLLQQCREVGGSGHADVGDVPVRDFARPGGLTRAGAAVRRRYECHRIAVVVAEHGGDDAGDCPRLE